MNAKNLMLELLQGFLSAAESGPDRFGAKEVAELLHACAANAAQGLADRTIDSDTADRLAEAGLDLNTIIANALFARAIELENQAPQEVAP